MPLKPRKKSIEIIHMKSSKWNHPPNFPLAPVAGACRQHTPQEMPRPRASPLPAARETVHGSPLLWPVAAPWFQRSALRARRSGSQQLPRHGSQQVWGGKSRNRPGFQLKGTPEPLPKVEVTWVEVWKWCLELPNFFAFWIGNSWWWPRGFRATPVDGEDQASHVRLLMPPCLCPSSHHWKLVQGWAKKTQNHNWWTSPVPIFQYGYPSCVPHGAGILTYITGPWGVSM